MSLLSSMYSATNGLAAHSDAMSVVSDNITNVNTIGFKAYRSRFEDVLRVNTRFERHLGLGVLPTTLRTHTFVAECFTTVAVVRSVEGHDAPEFDGASEVRRLANLP